MAISKRNWLRIIFVIFIVLACAYKASAASNEITIPIPSGSPGETYLESDSVTMIMEESDRIQGYHHASSFDDTGNTDVWAKLVIPKRAEIWVDCFQSTGDAFSYELLLSDRKTVVTSYKRIYKGNDPNLSSKLIAGVLPAGTYYLHIHNYIAWDCNTNTTISFITKYYDVVESAADDADEPNNTRASATRIGETKTGYLSYLGGDTCDWYTFDVSDDSADFSLSMTRKGYISYKLYKKGQDAPLYKGTIDGNNFGGWEHSFDQLLAKGSYDLCVTFEDYGADIEYYNFNRRGGLYDISVKKHVEETPETQTVTDTQVGDIPVSDSDDDWYSFFDFYLLPGSPVKVSGQSYEVIKSAEGNTKGTVAFTKAKNKKSVNVPASVKLYGKTYKVIKVSASAFTGKKIRTVTIGSNVKTIRKNAFKGSKATKVILKTKLLKKKTVKGCLNGSKVKTVQLKLGSKSLNKKYKKTYKKIFTKKNTGRKVAVK